MYGNKVLQIGRMMVIAVVLCAVMPFAAAASQETYKAAKADLERKQKAFTNADFELIRGEGALRTYQGELDKAQKAQAATAAQYNDANTRLNQAKAELQKAQSAKPQNKNTVASLQKKVQDLDKERNAKAQANNAAVQKVNNERNRMSSQANSVAAYRRNYAAADAAKKAAEAKVEKEKPWYLKAGASIAEGAEATIKWGQKVLKLTDFDKQEKAVKAASFAVQNLQRTPTLSLVTALETTGKYLGYINMGKTVADITGSLGALLTAGQAYAAAPVDSSARVNAVMSISISTLDVLEKSLSLKGGVITTSIASVCTQFFTSLIKSVANAIVLAKEATYFSTLHDEMVKRNWSDTRITVQGYSELALRAMRDGKTENQVAELVVAAQVVRNAN
jgi:predicted  nucleic acid-binding Zn-ribbon protein